MNEFNGLTGANEKELIVRRIELFGKKTSLDYFIEAVKSCRYKNGSYFNSDSQFEDILVIKGIATKAWDELRGSAKVRELWEYMEKNEGDFLKDVSDYDGGKVKKKEKLFCFSRRRK